MPDPHPAAMRAAEKIREKYIVLAISELMDQKHASNVNSGDIARLIERETRVGRLVDDLKELIAQHRLLVQIAFSSDTAAYELHGKARRRAERTLSLINGDQP